MLQSFFFVPASNRRFLDNIYSLKPDYFIFDLEDAISNKEIKNSLENLSGIETHDNYFVRLPSFNSIILIREIIDSLWKSGYRNFVVPKIESEEQLAVFNDYDSSYLLILLIESPLGLLQLPMFANKVNNLLGIGLGSHDYCASMEMRHTADNLYYPRMSLHTFCKANNILSIDIASMELEDMSNFQREARTAFEQGYDAKFVIHPNQLDVITNMDYFSENEIAEMKNIYSKIKGFDIENLSPIRHNGKLFEKPHFKKIIKIMKWYEKNGK